MRYVVGGCLDDGERLFPLRLRGCLLECNVVSTVTLNAGIAKVHVEPAVADERLDATLSPAKLPTVTVYEVGVGGVAAVTFRVNDCVTVPPVLLTTDVLLAEVIVGVVSGGVVTVKLTANV